MTIETCAKLIAIIAVAPTTEPELRSMPPEMITWVTPMAMMPMIDTCRMMIDSRAVLKIEVAFSRVLKRNESPISSQPSASKTTTISTSAKKTFSSGGRCRFDASKVRPPMPCEVCAMSGFPLRRLASPPSRTREMRGRRARAGPRGDHAPAAQFLARKSSMFAGVTSWNGM